MNPYDIRRLRQEHAISLVELSAWTGLPTSLLEQIEEKSAVALSGDLKRIEEALTRLIRERERGL